MNNINKTSITIAVCAYGFANTYIENMQTQPIIAKLANDDSANNIDNTYVTIYKCHFLCPKLSGTVYKLTDKYMTKEAIADAYMSGKELPANVKTEATMDMQLKKLIAGETVTGCYKVKEITAWSLPQLFPGGYQYHKYQFNNNKVYHSFGRIWW